MQSKSFFKYCQPPHMAPSDGFTILEAIFGIFVFTIGVLGLASMQIHSLGANVNACNTSKAMAAGTSLFSDLRALNYNGPDLSGDSEDGQMHDSGTVGRQTVSYHVRRLDAFEGEAAVITGNVSWTIRGRQRAETLHYFKIDEYQN